MLKKTITYKDYNDVERVEDFYFNLDMSELTMMELGVSGGLSEVLKKIVNAHDVPTLIAQFDKIVMASIGEKSADGKFFEKSEEISRRFKNTRAYDVLFMELVSDAKAASDFLNAIIPAGAAKQLEEHPEIVESVKRDLHITD